jgi:hypothetical protein
VHVVFDFRRVFNLRWYRGPGKVDWGRSTLRRTVDCLSEKWIHLEWRYIAGNNFPEFSLDIWVAPFEGGFQEMVPTRACRE